MQSIPQAPLERLRLTPRRLSADVPLEPLGRVLEIDVEHPSEVDIGVVVSGEVLHFVLNDTEGVIAALDAGATGDLREVIPTASMSLASDLSSVLIRALCFGIYRAEFSTVGSVNENVAPSPGSDSTQMSPS